MISRRGHFLPATGASAVFPCSVRGMGMIGCDRALKPECGYFKSSIDSLLLGSPGHGLQYEREASHRSVHVHDLCEHPRRHGEFGGAEGHLSRNAR